MPHSVADVLRFLQQFPAEKQFQTLLNEEPIARQFFQKLLLNQTDAGVAGARISEDPISKRLKTTRTSQTNSTCRNNLARRPLGQRPPSAGPDHTELVNNAHFRIFQLPEALPIQLEYHVQQELDSWIKRPWDFWKYSGVLSKHTSLPEGKEAFRIAFEISQSLEKAIQVNPLRHVFFGVLFAELAGRLKCYQASKRTVNSMNEFISPDEDWSLEQFMHCQILLRTGLRCQRTIRELMRLDGRNSQAGLDYGPLFFPERDQLKKKYKTKTQMEESMLVLYKRGIMIHTQQRRASSLAKKLLDCMLSNVKIQASSCSGRKRGSVGKDSSRKAPRINRGSEMNLDSPGRARMPVQVSIRDDLDLANRNSDRDTIGQGSRQHQVGLLFAESEAAINFCNESTEGQSAAFCSHTNAYSSTLRSRRTERPLEVLAGLASGSSLAPALCSLGQGAGATHPQVTAPACAEESSIFHDEALDIGNHCDVLAFDSTGAAWDYGLDMALDPDGIVWGIGNDYELDMALDPDDAPWHFGSDYGLDMALDPNGAARDIGNNYRAGMTIDPAGVALNMVNTCSSYSIAPRECYENFASLANSAPVIGASCT